MAVAERNALAVERLLDAGTDPDLRTRIDDHATPLEMAQSLGLIAIEAMLRRLEIAPHLGYGDRGVPGVIPEGAVLVVTEITVLDSA